MGSYRPPEKCVGAEQYVGAVLQSNGYATLFQLRREPSNGTRCKIVEMKIWKNNNRMWCVCVCVCALSLMDLTLESWMEFWIEI